jgi:two-component system, NarL family, sensor histidine kinase UhpB
MAAPRCRWSSPTSPNGRARSRELERSRCELRRLSANLVNAREEEQRRIARELHDELGQRLTALKMELAGLGARAMPGVPGERIAALCEMVDQTVASVRRIATDLRPLMLDDLGLIAAIEWLARESARRLGIGTSRCAWATPTRRSARPPRSRCIA